jgi:hypothetical protein
VFIAEGKGGHQRVVPMAERFFAVVGDYLLANDNSDESRLLVLVHPTPTKVPAADIWSDPSHQPRWTPTGLRARKLMSTQDIYDDLRRLEKTNTRLAWVDKVAIALERAVATIVDTAEQDRQHPLRAQVSAALAALIAELDGDHAALNGRLGRSPSPRPAANGSIAELLRHAVHRATGLSGKRPVKVEVVSPDLDDSGAPADQLLAGERLGHFFGFLDERFRQSDFALRYRNMRAWIKMVLPTYGLDAEVQTALPVVDAAYDSLGWDSVPFGNADFSDLSAAEKLRLLGLAGHIGHVVEYDVRHWHEGIPIPQP